MTKTTLNKLNTMNINILNNTLKPMLYNLQGEAVMPNLNEMHDTLNKKHAEQAATLTHEELVEYFTEIQTDKIMKEFRILMKIVETGAFARHN